jgi:putative aldouronate transport system substrate-binding protein
VDGTRDPAEFSEAMKLEFGQIQTDMETPRVDSASWGTRMARLDAALLLADGFNEVRTDPVATRVLGSDPTWPALKKLEEETFLQIITGARPVDDFDAFVEEWNNSGGMALLETMNQ